MQCYCILGYIGHTNELPTGSLYSRVQKCNKKIASEALCAVAKLITTAKTKEDVLNCFEPKLVDISRLFMQQLNHCVRRIRCLLSSTLLLRMDQRLHTELHLMKCNAHKPLRSSGMVRRGPAGPVPPLPNNPDH